MHAPASIAKVVVSTPSGQTLEMSRVVGMKCIMPTVPPICRRRRGDGMASGQLQCQQFELRE